MKLVELLARELKAWPVVDGVEPNYIVQEGDKELYSTTIRPIYGGQTTWHHSPNDDAENCGYFDVATDDLAEDWTAAIVTRTDWESERARIAKPAKKADKDGWIRHRGGKCPVDAGTVIEYRERNGNIEVECEPESLDTMWFHENHPHDIMAYRLHKPAEQVAPNKVGKLTIEVTARTEGVREVIEDMQMHIDQIDGPIKWRDRITEIEATTQALTTERAELVKKLASEGFALIGRINDLLTEAAQKHEDMSDWRNWKVGDLVEVLDAERTGLTVGNCYLIEQIEAIGYVGPCPIFLAGADHWLDVDNMQFHSRPSA